MKDQPIPDAIAAQNTCGNCKHFTEIRQSAEQIVATHVCKCGPPGAILIQLSAQAGQLRTIFPAVEATDSCGQFSPRLSS